MPSFEEEYQPPKADLATVESRRNDLAVEEFPEGPYGADIVAASISKSSPWRPEQRSASAYAYENRELHAGLEREYPEDHELHDEASNEASNEAIDEADDEAIDQANGDTFNYSGF